MVEHLLHKDEVIEAQWACHYCGDGKMATVNEGQAIVTNQRLIVAEDKSASSVSGMLPGAIIFGVIIIGRAATGHGTPGIIDGAIIGALSFGAGAVISNLFAKSKKKQTPAAKPQKEAFAVNLSDIASIEDGSRGVFKMLVVTSKSGTIFKVNTKDKNQTEALRKHLQAGN